MKIKHYTLVLLLSSISFLSCKKNQDLVTGQNDKATKGKDGKNITPNRLGDPGGGCVATVTELTAGQFYNAGSVTVTNDADFIYVTYTTANNYVLTETHLFVGDCAAIPLNNAGSPVPGLFPYSAAHNNETSYTYKVPISAIEAGNCGCIAAHAVVVKLDAGGNIIDQQTAWGSGYRIKPKGNWAMAFGYCSCAL